MKLFVDSMLMLELCLNRETEIRELSERLWKLLNQKPSEIQAYLSRNGLDQIYNIVSMDSKKVGSDVVNRLESLLVIHEGSQKVFKQVRQYEGDSDIAVDLYSAIELECQALVTERKDKYHNPSSNLSLWTVTELLNHLDNCKILEKTLKCSDDYSLQPELFDNLDNCNRKTLEKSWELSDNYYSQQAIFEKSIFEQLSIPLKQFESKSIINYRIRNSIQSVLNALNFLKQAGCQGLSKQELSEKMQKSLRTTNSIIWDLQHTGMIEIDSLTKKVSVKRALLDTNDQDISKYLETVLKKHLIVKKIYQHLKSGKLSNKWGLDGIIRETYSDEALSEKSIKDYKSRLYSWLIFANLL